MRTRSCNKSLRLDSDKENNNQHVFSQQPPKHEPRHQQTPTVQQQQQQPTFKLVFKRRRCDNNYEIVVPTTNTNTSTINPPSAKKQCTTPTVLEKHREKDEDYQKLIEEALNKKPRVTIKHSMPLPLALVNPKTDVIYTYGIFLLHLFTSYTQTCILCLQCKRFLSIDAFGQHFHVNAKDTDDESDDDGYDEDKEEVAKRVEEKLSRLRKNKYVVLPYFRTDNIGGELNAAQLKQWEIFQERVQYLRRLSQKKHEEVKAEIVETPTKSKEEIATPPKPQQPMQSIVGNLLMNKLAEKGIQVNGIKVITLNKPQVISN
jgi:hypothetical protein